MRRTLNDQNQETLPIFLRSAHATDPAIAKVFREKFDFLAALALNMLPAKCRGARDLLVVKVSASYASWRSKKHRKTKIQEIAFFADFLVLG